MATRELYEWEKTDASNNFPADEGGWAEGMKRSDVNDAARADMGSVRRWYDDPEWLNITVNGTLNRVSDTRIDVVGQDASSYFTDGRRVRVTGGTPSPFFATVNGNSVFNNPDTQVDLNEFSTGTAVPTTPVLMDAYITSEISSSVFLDDIFVRVTTLTSAAIQVAIDALEADAGGIIVLEAGATYVMSEQVDIGEGTSEGNIRIMGRGAILKADVALDGITMLEIRDSLGALIEVNTILEDIIFDGASGVMSAASDDVPLVLIGGNIENVWVRSCGFNDSWSSGISILGGSNRIWVSECQFKDNGKHGIQITDAADDLNRIFIRGCSFDTPNAQGTATGSGIRVQGRVRISDCSFVNFDHGSNVEVGITIANQSEEVTVTGCRFEGTGLNARGITMAGDDCTVSTCVFNYTGAGTEGIQVEHSAGAALRNIISGCNFIDCQHSIRMEATSEDCIVNGNVFTSSPFPITDAGKRNKIIGNLLNTGTDGITLSSTAEETTVANNTIENFSSDGITVNSATDSQLSYNLTSNISVLHVNDTGTRTGQRSGVVFSLEFALGDTITAMSATTTEALVSDGGGNDYEVSFAAWADGNREWIVESAYIQGAFGADDSSPTPVLMRLRHGTDSSTPTGDTEICRQYIQFGAKGLSGLASVQEDDGWNISFPEVIFTPVAGDSIYLTVEADSSTMDLDFFGTTGTFNGYFRVRPR